MDFGSENIHESFPPFVLLHVLFAVFSLRFQLVVPEAQEPEILRRVRAALCKRNDMIHLEILRLFTPLAVVTYVCAPAPVPNEYFVPDRLGDVPAALHGASPRAPFAPLSRGFCILF